MKLIAHFFVAALVTLSVHADVAVQPFSTGPLPLGDTWGYVVSTTNLNITGVANVPATGGRSGTMIVVAGANIALANAPELNFSDNLTSRQLTNGQSVKIQADVIAGIRTNTTIVSYPGAPYVAGTVAGGGGTGGNTNSGGGVTNSGTSSGGIAGDGLDSFTDPNRPDLLWYPFTNNIYLNAPTNGTVILMDHSVLGGLDGSFVQPDARPWAPDPFGTTNAAHWSGAQTILTVPGSASWLSWTNQNRTLSFWIYAETFNWPILGNVDSGGNGFYMACSSQGNLVVTTCSPANGGASVSETSPSLTSRVWTHVTVLFNGGTNISLWINGFPDATQTTTFAKPLGLSKADLQVGYTNSTGDIDGNIYDIKLWSYLRTPAQIQADYLHSANVTNGLIAWYKGSGNANDSSGNGHNGLWGGGAAAYSTNRDGFANSAFSFDGVSTFIDTGLICDSSTFPNGYTLNFWALAQTGSNSRNPMGDINSDCSAGMVGPIDLNNTFFNRSFIPGQTDVTGGTWQDNRWYMVTVYYDKTRMQIYTNGVPINAALSGASGNVVTSGTTLKLGRWGDFQWQGQYRLFSGQVSDIRLYTNVLSNPAISLLYENGPAH